MIFSSCILSMGALLHAIDRNRATQQSFACRIYLIFSDDCGLRVAMQNCPPFGPRLIPLPTTSDGSLMSEMGL
jgi:hypothetical protein